MAANKNVKGLITGEHVDEIEKVFGAEVANRVRNADKPTTFLDILVASSTL